MAKDMLHVVFEQLCSIIVFHPPTIAAAVDCDNMMVRVVLVEMIGCHGVHDRVRTDGLVGYYIYSPLVQIIISGYDTNMRIPRHLPLLSRLLRCRCWLY